MATPQLAVFYEHPQWFKPLFAELDSRKIHYDKIHVSGLRFDPGRIDFPYKLVVNRVSAYPSATSDPRVVLYVKQFLAFLEHLGVRVVNGWRSYEVGTSKALQMGIFRKLGLNTPESRVIHHAGQAVDAAEELRFPVLIKPNVGGSGAGIVRFDSREELNRAATAGEIDLGIDGVALVQEYLKPKDDSIYRVEVLNDTFLYGIRLPILKESFNYCPADGCNIERFDYCPVGEPKTAAGPGITAFTPPGEVIEKVISVMAAAGADLGGVEYLIGDDDQLYFYDINPLSNFVADPVNVVGFDPVPRFVDFVLSRIK